MQRTVLSTSALCQFVHFAGQLAQSHLFANAQAHVMCVVWSRIATPGRPVALAGCSSAGRLPRSLGSTEGHWQAGGGAAALAALGEATCATVHDSAMSTARAGTCSAAPPPSILAPVACSGCGGQPTLRALGVRRSRNLVRPARARGLAPRVGPRIKGGPLGRRRFLIPLNEGGGPWAP